MTWVRLGMSKLDGPGLTQSLLLNQLYAKAAQLIGNARTPSASPLASFAASWGWFETSHRLFQDRPYQGSEYGRPLAVAGISFHYTGCDDDGDDDGDDGDDDDRIGLTAHCFSEMLRSAVRLWLSTARQHLGLAPISRHRNWLAMHRSPSERVMRELTRGFRARQRLLAIQQFSFPRHVLLRCP